MRTVHVYVSMISMLIVAFFAVTGLTLNHPTWSLDIGTIDYAGPGYSANVTFSLTDGTLTTSVTQSDLLAILNDVHKGRDTDSSWGWVIDASAVLLLVVTLTGVGIQIFQRKRRRSALLTAGALSVLTVALIWVAIH